MIRKVLIGVGKLTYNAYVRSKAMLIALPLAAVVLQYGVFTWLPLTYNVGLGPLDHNARTQNVLIVAALKFADGNDKVIIHVNSPGGYVSQAVMIINAMKSSRATVIAHNHGLAASAAGLISMAADEIRVNDSTIYMRNIRFTTSDKPAAANFSL